MSLKTDFKDAIPASGAGTLRKYQQIDNGDGTISFQDVTEYSQVGDKAQASVFNAICDAINKGAFVPLSCTKSGTTYALTGLTATSGKVPVMFAVPTAYASGDTVTIDSTAYALATRDGSALVAGAWAAGKIVTGIADIDAKVLTVEPSNPVGSATKSKTYTATLTASGWSGSATPYSQTISVESVTTTSANELLPAADITAEQLDALQATNLQDGGQVAGSLTLLAYGDKPTIDLPVRIIVRGDL